MYIYFYSKYIKLNKRDETTLNKKNAFKTLQLDMLISSVNVTNTALFV